MGLRGQTVLVTRMEPPNGKLSRLLEQHGATVVHLPVFQISAPHDWKPFDQAARNIRQITWTLFTSANAVNWTFHRLEALGLKLSNTKFATVGPATAEALEQHGFAPEWVAPQFQGRTLAEGLAERLVPDDVCWLPQSEIADSEISERLRASGVTAWATPAYSNMPQPPDPELLRPYLARSQTWVTFASPSAVRAFFDSSYFRDAPRELARHACIGETTAQALIELGRTPSAVGAPQTLEGMVESMLKAPS
jgi:uroporphyrinogen-III synthase